VLVSASTGDVSPFLYIVAANLQVKIGLVMVVMSMSWEIFADALSLSSDVVPSPQAFKAIQLQVY
jgi:hypothetical protein